MHAVEAYRLRHEWKTSRLQCPHPRYEAETIYSVPTGKTVCTHCGAILTASDIASLAIRQRQENHSTDISLG
jgi:hypothetical protein